MRKGWISGVILAGLLAGPATAASWSSEPTAWIVSPGEDSCRVDIDLAGRSGAQAEISLYSDGDRVTLRFGKDGLPERAFLPIRIDQKPFSNLSQRTQDPKVGVITLSEESLAALRKGRTLQIAWLTDETLSAALAGSERGLADLRTCGAQVAADHRARLAAEQLAQSQAQADARTKALADEQLAVVQAQRRAAKAESQRVAAEAERLHAEADAQRQRAANEAQAVARAQAQAEVDRQQIEADRERAAQAQYDEPPSYPAQYARPGWGYRSYDPGDYPR
jgi:DNA segregation ATPase FtsK/SpoIIIE-like protein